MQTIILSPSFLQTNQNEFSHPYLKIFIIYIIVHEIKTSKINLQLANH